MRGVTFIGVPLTVLQLGIHSHTGANVDSWTVANDVWVCNAICDADRIDAPFWHSKHIGTRTSTFLSSSYDDIWCPSSSPCMLDAPQ